MVRMIFLIAAAVNFLCAQNTDSVGGYLAMLNAEIQGDTTVYLSADKMPEIEGGVQALASKIIYPAEAKKNGTEGTVFVSGVVDEEGRVKNPQILKSAGDLLDKAAIKAFAQLKFIPGEKGGKKVKVKITLPINFKLGDKPEGAEEEKKLKLKQKQEQEGVPTKVEVMPEIEGGMETLAKNIVYPKTAQEAGIQGKVFVSAVIDEYGKATELKVIKELGSGLDEAAMEAVRKTKFIPGKNNGKAVKVQITIPIMFKLN